MTGVGCFLRRAAVALAGISLAGNALAQVSGEVSVSSDNEFRGFSLNDNRPAPAAELNFDSSAGWFASGFASEVRFFSQASPSAEIALDVGYAQSINSGLTWELGATSYIFPNFTFYNYNEFFAGLLSNNWSTRLYVAPNYFGRSRQTVYAEFNYSQPLDDHFRLLGHVGALQGGFQPGNTNARTFDTSVGLGAKLNNVDLRLNWVAANHQNYLYPVMMAVSRSEWLLTVAYLY